jgi:Flp pilus assembly protein TadG
MKSSMTRKKKNKNEQGYVAVTVAIMLAVLLGFSALAVDLGMMYSARASAQNAADAAALAGAFTFITQPASQPQSASDNARQIALSTPILGDTLTAADVDIQVDFPNRIVTVGVGQNRGMFFSRFLGRTQATIGATAVAAVSAAATGAYCVKPWYLPNTIASIKTPCDACSASEVLIQNGSLTNYGLNNLGNDIFLKPQQPTFTFNPGDFQAFDFPGSSGASDYRNNIAVCPAAAAICKESYSLASGNMVGPTTQGVEDLLKILPPDEYLAVGRYRRPDGTIVDTSKKLILAPVWDTCGMPGFCPGNKFPSGTKSIAVAGFALVFLENVQAEAVEARLINAFQCGPGSPGASEVAPFSVPVRLVHKD